MKKALSLILALVLCLSLCACGRTESAETKPSNEDILKEASAINLDTIGRAFADNKVNAEEKYYNHNYTLVGTVTQIESEEVILRPITAVFGSRITFASRCRVRLPIDEIKTLSKYDVITVCGKLTYFNNGYDHYELTLDEAFYVDNQVEITAEISDVNNYWGGEKSIVLQESVRNGDYYGYVYYEIIVAESGAENSEEAEYMGTTYQIGDEVTFTGILKWNPDRGSNYYEVDTVNTISKN